MISEWNAFDRHETILTTDRLGGDKEMLILKKLEAKAFWDQRQREADENDECLHVSPDRKDMFGSALNQYTRL